jgi:hypothetical protein
MLLARIKGIFSLWRFSPSVEGNSHRSKALSKISDDFENPDDSPDRCPHPFPILGLPDFEPPGPDRTIDSSIGSAKKEYYYDLLINY